MKKLEACTTEYVFSIFDHPCVPISWSTFHSICMFPPDQNVAGASCSQSNEASANAKRRKNCKSTTSVHTVEDASNVEILLRYVKNQRWSLHTIPQIYRLVASSSMKYSGVRLWYKFSPVHSSWMGMEWTLSRYTEATQEEIALRQSVANLERNNKAIRERTPFRAVRWQNWSW